MQHHLCGYHPEHKTIRHLEKKNHKMFQRLRELMELKTAIHQSKLAQSMSTDLPIKKHQFTIDPLWVAETRFCQSSLTFIPCHLYHKVKTHDQYCPQACTTTCLAAPIKNYPLPKIDLLFGAKQKISIRSRVLPLQAPQDRLLDVRTGSHFLFEP